MAYQGLWGPWKELGRPRGHSPSRGSLMALPHPHPSRCITQGPDHTWGGAARMGAPAWALPGGCHLSRAPLFPPQRREPTSNLACGKWGAWSLGSTRAVAPPPSDTAPCFPQCPSPRLHTAPRRSRPARPSCAARVGACARARCCVCRAATFTSSASSAKVSARLGFGPLWPSSSLGIPSG